MVKSERHFLMAVARENEEEAKAETPYKTIRSHETYSLSQEQHRKNLPPFSYLPPDPCLNTWEFKLRFGWGHSKTISNICYHKSGYEHEAMGPIKQ